MSCRARDGEDFKLEYQLRDGTHWMGHRETLEAESFLLQTKVSRKAGSETVWCSGCLLEVSLLMLTLRVMRNQNKAQGEVS